MSRAGPVRAGCFGVGWPGCHVIAKLIFVAFNKHAEIPANSNQPGSYNQALRLQNSRFRTFSEGGKRRKRDPRVRIWSVVRVRKKYDCFAV